MVCLLSDHFSSLCIPVTYSYLFPSCIYGLFLWVIISLLNSIRSSGKALARWHGVWKFWDEKAMAEEGISLSLLEREQDKITEWWSPPYLSRIGDVVHLVHVLEQRFKICIWFIFWKFWARLTDFVWLRDMQWGSSDTPLKWGVYVRYMYQIPIFVWYSYDTWSI